MAFILNIEQYFSLKTFSSILLLAIKIRLGLGYLCLGFGLGKLWYRTGDSKKN